METYTKECHFDIVKRSLHCGYVKGGSSSLCLMFHTSYPAGNSGSALLGDALAAAGTDDFSPVHSELAQCYHLHNSSVEHYISADHCTGPQSSSEEHHIAVV